MLGAEKMEKLVNEMEPIATQMSWQINIKTVKQEMDHFSNKREGGMEEGGKGREYSPPQCYLHQPLQTGCPDQSSPW